MEFSPGLFMPADSSRWLERILAGLEALERVLGVSLDRASGGTKFRATTTILKDRRKYFAQRLKTRNRWFSLSNGGRFERTPTFVRNVDFTNAP